MASILAVMEAFYEFPPIVDGIVHPRDIALPDLLLRRSFLQ